MISAVSSSLRRWFSVLLTLTLALTCQLALTSCNPQQFKTRAAQVSQLVQPGEPPIQGWEVSDWEKEIDRLFIEGSRELDEAKRKAIYAQFQQIVQEQLPLIYLVNRLSFQAVRDRVQGVKFSALAGSAFWNLYELKVVEN